MAVDSELGQIAEHDMVPERQVPSVKTEYLGEIIAHDVGANQKSEKAVEDKKTN